MIKKSRRGLTLFRGAEEVLTLSGVARKQGRRIEEDDLSILRKAILITDNQNIVYVGPLTKVPIEIRKDIKKEVHLECATLMPGFVESHTHLVFAGDRSDEFEMRNQGVSYQEIAAKGGGILSTVQATRRASVSDLTQLAAKRMQNFVSQGVVCLEGKTGYGLDAKSEMKMLEVYRRLSKMPNSPQIVPTFLGAHARPRVEGGLQVTELNYLAQLKKVLPIIKKKKLSERVDIFIEKGFFSVESAREYLQDAQRFGFQVVIHADQLSLCGGTELAIELMALSADHVIQISEVQQKKIANSRTVAVLLPAADLYMRCSYPPARNILDLGGRVALATDFNPGSSPTQDLSLVGVLARLEMKMTLPEVITAYTYSAAAALGFENKMGSLEVGKEANFVCVSENWSKLFYSIGNHPVQKVYRKSKKIRSS